MVKKPNKKTSASKIKTILPKESDLSYSTEEKRSRKKLYILLAIIILGAITIPLLYSKNNLNKFKTKIIPDAIKQVINNPETKFSIGKVKETSGVYEFELTIGEGTNSQKYTSYISKDGKVLFTSGIVLKKEDKPTPTPVKKASCNDLEKSDKPSLTAFVVANCPFGLQMQRLYSKALGELSDLSKYLEIKYIGSVTDGKITSMHGDEEAQENLRQICIREEQPTKYWPYVSCYMKAEGQSANCLTTTGIDQVALTTCTTDANKGLKYAQADFDLANKFGVSGSPTLLLNNKETVSEFDFGGRVADAVKQIVCCGSKTKPAFCNKTLSKEEVASAFSETDTTSGDNSSASCN